MFYGLQKLAIASSKVRDCIDLAICIDVCSQMQIFQEGPVIAPDHKAVPRR